MFDFFKKNKKKSSEAEEKKTVESKTNEPKTVETKPPIQLAFEKNLSFLRKDTLEKETVQNLFTNRELIEVIQIGKTTFPTGEIVIADPLVYLGNDRYTDLLNRQIPVGEYPVELSICYSPIAGVRIAAARLKVREETPVRYEITMPKGKTVKDYNTPGVLTGFGVDAGLACFCDGIVAKEFDAFQSKWRQEHPGGNLYDDYFAEIFAQSYEQQPQVQREGGDFITWKIPGTEHVFSMFASGLGDGFYTGFWGLNSTDEVCELVVPFMNPEYFI